MSVQKDNRRTEVGHLCFWQCSFFALLSFETLWILKSNFKCKTNCFRWRDYLTKPQNFEGMHSRWSMEVSRILLTKRDDWQDYIWPDIRSSWTFFRGIGKYDINMLNAYRQHDRLFQNEKINCDYFYLLKFVGRAEFNSVALDSKSIFSWATVQFVIALETHFQSGSTQRSWCCYCFMVLRRKDKYICSPFSLFSLRYMSDSFHQFV